MCNKYEKLFYIAKKIFTVKYILTFKNNDNHAEDLFD